jgi:hypothetical protein
MLQKIDRVLIRAYRMARRIDGPIEVREIDGASPQIDRLWSESSHRMGVIGLRDALFAQWRYFDNPVSRQRVVAIADREHWIGWAALEFAAHGCLIVDHLVAADEEGRALRALIEYASRLGAPKLTVFTMGSSISNATFLGHGFIPGRYAGAVQLLCPSGPPDLLTRCADWYFRAGDLDPESCRWSAPSRHRRWSDPNYQGVEQGQADRAFTLRRRPPQAAEAGAPMDVRAQT